MHTPERQRAAGGYVFATDDGQPLHPDVFIRRFKVLIRQSSMPPVRLHDLRHGAATIAHAAGVDLKSIQDQLGHASIKLTADTYTNVLAGPQFQAAEATAALVIAAGDKAARRRPAGPLRTPVHVLRAGRGTGRGGVRLGHHGISTASRRPRPATS